MQSYLRCCLSPTQFILSANLAGVSFYAVIKKFGIAGNVRTPEPFLSPTYTSHIIPSYSTSCIGIGSNFIRILFQMSKFHMQYILRT